MTGFARIDGKFLEIRGRRFLVKGVAYGTFAPGASGVMFPPSVRMSEDFAQMAVAGINTIRTYTVPSEELLDTAARHGLRVIVGLPWLQHIAFLDDRRRTRDIRHEAAAAVRRLASHPATLLFAVGNEIPAPIVRWHGRRGIERFLRGLYQQIKDVAPDTLLTYVNFPPTEYLDLDCFDVCAFNVYLHREMNLRAYLARLQHIAGSRPLLLTEAGADSRREGPEGQARIAAMQVRTAFTEGACGAVTFTWTDEWWRGGRSVTDWAFGLVDVERRPKPALAAVEQAFANAPFSADARARWPKVSVVVCARDAADTIAECLTSLSTQTYPNTEIILVNDGSRDATGTIARRHAGVRVIDVPNGGLGAARNVGLAHATGEIIAYTDADVRADPDWLTYLVQPMLTSDVVGSGGPNVVPPDDSWIAQCVARAPGGPTHVLLDDRVAEHVPGCNMAFRRQALMSIGGFNPVYLRAGDDVDICWRLQARGFRIGFAPSALVWHHHRATVKAFWRQQIGYGEGETWLDAHHPEKFVVGQMLWHGRIYSPLPFVRSFAGRRINTGVWGTAAFPSIYITNTYRFQFLPHSPAWMAASLALVIAGAIGLWKQTEAGWLLLGAGTIGWTITCSRCALFAWRSNLHGVQQSHLRCRLLIAWLHLIQPLARLRGRIRGISSMPQRIAPEHVTGRPWKAPVPTLRDAVGTIRLFAGISSTRSYWSESWSAQTTLLAELAAILRTSRPPQLVVVDDGWRTDRDLSLAIGRWAWLHVQALIEEHEQGSCLLRVRRRLRPSFIGTAQGLMLAALFVGGTSAAMAIHPSSVIIGAVMAAAVILGRGAWQAARAATVLDRALARIAADAGMLPLLFESRPGRRYSTQTGGVPMHARAEGSAQVGRLGETSARNLAAQPSDASVQGAS